LFPFTIACHACGAHLIYFVWQKMHETHFLPNKINVLLREAHFSHNLRNLCSDWRPAVGVGMLGKKDFWG
jgi:hypothetical protein